MYKTCCEKHGKSRLNCYIAGFLNARIFQFPTYLEPLAPRQANISGNETRPLVNHIYRERTEDEGWGPSCLGSFCGIFSPWKKSSKISNSAVGLRCLRLAGRQFAKAWSKRSTQLGLEQTPLDPCFIQISSELANHRFYNFPKKMSNKTWQLYNIIKNTNVSHFCFWFQVDLGRA